MPTNSQQASQNRFAFIDALRGLAALYVVTYHLTLIPVPNLDLPQWIKPFILHGGSGVTLFFIISAFTLTYSSKRREKEYKPTQKFYIRRIFRILPLFYFWLVISLLRDYFIFHATHPLDEVLLSIFFGFNFIPGKSAGIVWASWTLGIEVVFYVIFPLIYRYVNDIWKSLLFLCLTIVFSMYWQDNAQHYLSIPDSLSQDFLYFSFLHHLPTFAIGVLVYYIYEKVNSLDTVPPSFANALVGVSILGYYTVITLRINSLVFDNLLWTSIILSIFVVGLMMSPLSVFVNKITRFYGDISYSLYLNHPTFVFFLVPLFRFFYGLALPVTLMYGLSLLATVAMITVVSYLTYKLIEQPGMRLGKNIIKKTG